MEKIHLLPCYLYYHNNLLAANDYEYFMYFCRINYENIAIFMHLSIFERRKWWKINKQGQLKKQLALLEKHKSMQRYKIN